MFQRTIPALALTALTALLVAAPPAALAQSAPAAAPAPAAASPAPVMGPEDVTTTKLAQQVLETLGKGKFDRSLFSDAMNKSITDSMVDMAVKSFAQAGTPQWTYLGQYPAEGTPRQVYRVKFQSFAVILTAHKDADSKLDLYTVTADKPQPK
ncbi:MAG TPA: hypothetical protein VE826_13950 [Dongiaceae bacterium]|nr:hypothetical protein [Dongiaceae bacterium]